MNMILKKIIDIYKISAISIISIFIFNSENLKMRFVGQMKSYFTHKNEYFIIYKSAYEVFKNYKFFWVGNKNYRVETCDI